MTMFEDGREPGVATTATAPSRRKGAVAVGVAAVGVVLVAVLVSRNPGPPDDPIALDTPPTASPIAGTSAPPTTATVPVTEPPDSTIGTTTTTRKPRRVPTGPPGPLTGSPVDLPGYEQRPALVVKIDNYDPGARPQAGLTLADIVFEEKVEGPISRFAAVFQGADADQIGPVRSARSTDVEITGNLNHPLFSYSGANGAFQDLVNSSPLIDVGAGSAKGGAYWRGGDKVIPHNLYTSSSQLRAGVPGAAPAQPWPFRGVDEPAGPGSTPAVSASYHFGGGVTAVTWTWDTAEGGWVRTQNGSIHYDLDNWPVTVQNLVIQYVPYVRSNAEQQSGEPIPEAALGGTGRSWVLTGGAAIPATWTRFGLEAPTFYNGPDGSPVRFAPGHTWVALVPVELPATVRFANGGAAS